ncbi:MAG TPA: FecR domain-containing protein [Devosia sp.]|nr:FecR domain-containing protein [Devosia sp.]
MQKLTLHAAILLLLLATCGHAAAAAGTAAGVDPAAEARGKNTRTLVVGDDIFIGDRIVTNARGLVQIIFDDKTKLVVGPGSALLIEDYLRRDDGSAGRLAVNALSGTFRFITGNSAKGKYLITTPTGQIGVRGTAFDLYVTKAATHVLQLHGATINCSRNGACENMTKVCNYSVIKAGGVAVSPRVPSADKAGAWFGLARSQGPLLRPFRVAGAEKCVRPSAGAAPDVPQSISDGPPVRQQPVGGPGF